MMRQVVVVVLTVMGSAPAVARAQEAQPKRFSIQGTWDLNVAKSDEPQSRMRRGMGGGGGRGGFGGRGGGGRGGGGRGGRPEGPPPDEGSGPDSRGGSGGMGGMMAPAYRLVFVQSDSMLTITVPGNSIRRIRIDRPSVEDTALDGRVSTIKTKLEEKKLVVERESEMGKMTEAYEFDKDTGELVIKTKVSGRRGSFDFKRVYVKSKDQ